MNRYGMYNDFYFTLGIISYAVFMFIIMGLLFVPMLQNFVESGRRKWFARSIQNQVATNVISKENGQSLLNDIEDKREHNLYKSLKLYYALFSIYAVFMGIIFFFMSFLGMELNNISTVINIMYFSPIVYGSTLFLFYILVAPHNRLLGELGTFSLFVGSCIFILGFTSKFELTFIRGEFLVFLVLSIGLFLIYKYKAILVSYLYAAIIALAGLSNLAAAFAQDYGVRMSKYLGDRDYNTAPYFDIYDGFFSYFYWLFAAALLFLWHGRLKAANDITIKEIFFGIFAFLMIMSLSIFVTGQYWLIGGTIGLFLSFIYSSYYFGKSDWFLSKPIHLIIIFLISTCGIFGNSLLLSIVTKNIMWFGFDGISAWLGIFAMILLLGIGGAVVWFKFILPKKKFNYILLAFPLVLILGIALGNYGGSYLFILYLLGLGGYYTWCGLSNKDEPYILVGTVLFIQGTTIKVAELFTPGEMPKYSLRNKNDIQEYVSHLFMNNAIMFMLFGIIFAGIVYFLRENWKISGVGLTPNNYKNQISKSETDIID